MELHEYFRINKSEHWFFRMIKPIGWVLFALFLIGLLVSSFFYFFILFKEFGHYKPLTISDASLQYEQIAKFFADDIGTKLFYLNISFLVFVICSFGVILTRINTKIWCCLRNINQYHTLTCVFHNNLSKLIISLIFGFISICALAIVFVFCFFTIKWLYASHVNINNDYKETYEVLLSTQNVDIANQKIILFSSNIKKSLQPINFNNFLTENKNYLIFGMLGLAIFIVSNIAYGITVLFYRPGEKEVNLYADDEWDYLNLVDESFINSKKLKVGKPMSYQDYESYITNGYSGKKAGLRDRQYEIYKHRNQEF